LAFKEKKKQEQVTIFHTWFSGTKMWFSHLVNISLFSSILTALYILSHIVQGYIFVK
jgi:hypothetical protein